MKRGKNMIASVKKCIDNGDIIGLRYIFLDSLDIDPTFEKYKDDYHFCEKLAGMFEPYIELTPFSIAFTQVSILGIIPPEITPSSIKAGISSTFIF